MKAEDTVDFHIKTIWHGINRMYNSFAMQYDMTMSSGFVLLNIDKDGTPATKIAPALGLETRSLTRILKSLEDKKWIRREISRSDKRIVNIYLTDLGIEKRNIAKNGVLIFNNVVKSKVEKDKLAIFFDVMSDISKLVTEEAANYKTDLTLSN